MSTIGRFQPTGWKFLQIRQSGLQRKSIDQTAIVVRSHRQEAIEKRQQGPNMAQGAWTSERRIDPTRAETDAVAHPDRRRRLPIWKDEIQGTAALTRSQSASIRNYEIGSELKEEPRPSIFVRVCRTDAKQVDHAEGALNAEA